jgi:uncharacterized RDD family membrane protein YckC
VNLASPTRRVAAYLLDIGASTLFIAPFLTGMRLTGDWGDGEFDLVAFYAWGIPACLAGLTLIVHLEGKKGATPGKRLLGLRVADAETGKLIGWNRALARRLMFAVEPFSFGLAYLLALRDERRQTWHDKVARSVVLGS